MLASAMLMVALPGAAQAADPFDFQKSYTTRLTANEATSSFDIGAQPTLLPQGVRRFAVEVPKSAKSKHSVGIDGGAYDDIEGEPVTAGRATSITAYFKPGEYVIYDAYKNNRQLGYATTFTFYPRDDFGWGCKLPDDLKADSERFRVSRIDCKRAEKVARFARMSTLHNRSPHVKPAIIYRLAGWSCKDRETTMGSQLLPAYRIDCKSTSKRKKHVRQVHLTVLKPAGY